MRCGINRETGEFIYGVDACRAAIVDILGTPVGTCTLNREYGSQLFQLVDRPIDRTFMGNLYQATVVAILRWENEFKPYRVRADLTNWGQGQVALDLNGLYTPDGKVINLDGILVNVFKRQ